MSYSTVLVIPLTASLNRVTMPWASAGQLHRCTGSRSVPAMSEARAPDSGASPVASSPLHPPALTPYAPSPMRPSLLPSPQSLSETLKGMSPSLVRQVLPLLEQLAPLYLDAAQGKQVGQGTHSRATPFAFVTTLHCCPLHCRTYRQDGGLPRLRLVQRLADAREHVACSSACADMCSCVVWASS